MPSSGGQTSALDRKSTRLNSSHGSISYAVFSLKKTTKLPGPCRPALLGSPLCSAAASRRRRAARVVGGSRQLVPAPTDRRPRVKLFFFNDTATTEIYTLSLHDALPISRAGGAHLEDHRARQRDLSNRRPH